MFCIRQQTVVLTKTKNKPNLDDGLFEFKTGKIN